MAVLMSMRKTDFPGKFLIDRFLCYLTWSDMDRVPHTQDARPVPRELQAALKSQALLSSHWEDGGAHWLAQEQDAEEMDSALHRTTFVTLDEEHAGTHIQKASEPLCFI